MRRHLAWVVLFAFVASAHAQSDREQTIAIMKKVADWQLANLPEKDTKDKGKAPANLGWIRGACFTGMMALYDTTKDEKYLNAMLKIGKGNDWKPGPRRHADDHCVGQTYCELYLIKKDGKMIAPFRERIDKNMSEEKPGRVEFWWCDSLFMEPPALARLASATGDKKYLDYMNRMWWDCTDFLYDKEEHLYFRDKSFFEKKEGNGKKVFWSRGNGWVMGGIVRVLQYMPQDYPDRAKYVNLLKEMSEKLITCQQPDGFWKASLLDPASRPGGESSGTGFYTYAFAWGINNGILDRAKYLPTVEKGWKALCGAVNDSGKLGWVQPVGSKPDPVKAEDTREYGVGAFLLAGSEIVKLNEKKP